VIQSVGAGAVAGAITILMWVRYEAGNGHYYAFGATLVGMAIAWAMALVAGRKRGPKLQLLAMGITAVAMAIGQYLVVNTLIAKYYRDHPTAEHLKWWSAAGMLWTGGIFGDAKFFLLGLVFAGFVPHKRPPAPQREGLK
jgi:MFS family permease